MASQSSAGRQIRTRSLRASGKRIIADVKRTHLDIFLAEAFTRPRDDAHPWLGRFQSYTYAWRTRKQEEIESYF